MMVKRIFLLVCLAVGTVKTSSAQSVNCRFGAPFFHLHFGKGQVPDVNTSSLALYEMVPFDCPGDGQYAYTPRTTECFGGDWHTLTEDHTPGDVGGNMLVVNSAYNSGTFLTTRVKGFKGEKTYQFGMWLMNLCRPSRKCPFPLLPNLSILLQTVDRKTIARFHTGELPRTSEPQWIKHSAQFKMPFAETEVILTLQDDAPGGCGNDFALDDITFSECLTIPPVKPSAPKKTPVAIEKPIVKRESPKKQVPQQVPVKTAKQIATVTKIETPLPSPSHSIQLPQPAALIPPVLKQRTNTLAKHIDVDAGTIVIELYDNGEIDGDTVSIYHNNVLIVDRQRLSQKAISYRLQVDKAQPHHELVMVADNLGSIPPNTSLMIVTTKDNRYQVFISSTEQQNAKVVIDLKE